MPSSTPSTAVRKCEFCDSPLETMEVSIRGRVASVPLFGSCGCNRSREKLESFGRSGMHYSETMHRCPVCGEQMMLDGRTGTVSDCPRCGYSCVFSSDLDRANAGMRAATGDGILSGTGVPELYWGVEPDTARAGKIAETGKGLYIVGGNGTYKTRTACSIAKALAEVGWKVRFASSVKMLSEFKDTYGTSKSESEVFEELSGCDMLVIDDLGKENPTSWAGAMLYAVIDGRYGAGKPVIITTNYTEDELVARIAQGSDESTARALVSRLFEMTENMRLDGPDRRMS